MCNRGNVILIFISNFVIYVFIIKYVFFGDMIMFVEKLFINFSKVVDFEFINYYVFY